LWIASDHLLLVKSTRVAEQYKRFYFRDIQAFVIREKTFSFNRNMVDAVLWLVLVGLFLYLNRAPFAFAAGAAVLVALRFRMNVMSLPEEEARALGVATGPLRIAIVAAATLVTSASVATAGIIGWVGLVVPHLARSLVGPDFARLLPAAAILGGGYLLVIDTLARTMAQVEIPLGILTAVIGTPFFIWLLASVQKNWS